MGVTTPCKGKIDKITVQLKETYPVGAVLGYVEASEADAARFAKHAPAPPPQKEVAEEIPARADQEVLQREIEDPLARDGDGGPALAACPFQRHERRNFYVAARSCTDGRTAVNNRRSRRNHGTGAGNRVTIKDLENFLHKIDNQTAQEASTIRAGVADAMRRSWTRPLSTIGSSVNLDPVLQDRQSRDPKPGLGLYAFARSRLLWQKIQAQRRN